LEALGVGVAVTAGVNVGVMEVLAVANAVGSTPSVSSMSFLLTTSFPSEVEEAEGLTEGVGATSQYGGSTKDHMPVSLLQELAVVSPTNPGKQ
jgi:hypothetical protein